MSADQSRYLRTILDGTPSGILLLAPDGALRDANRAGAALLGAAGAEALVGRALVDFAAERDRALLRAAIAGACAGEERTIAFELAAGAPHRVGARVVPFCDEAGAVVGALAVARDLTERDLAARAAMTASETRYRTLLRNRPDSAVFLFDHDLRFLVAEGDALVAAGVDPALVVGHRPWHVLGRAGAELVVPHYRAALEGEERRFEYPFAGRIYAAHVVPVRDTIGEVAGGLMVARDVTASIEQQRALEGALETARASEARVRAAFDAMPGSMAIIDAETARFVNFNDAACERLGYTREEFAGMTVMDIEGNPDRDAVLAIVRGNITSHERQQFRTRHRAKSGELREVLVTALGYVDDGRHVACCTWLDVTEQERLEQQLRQAQKMEAVGQLAGGIAHDFNNLLTVIAGNVEFMRGDLPPDLPQDGALREELAEIADAVDRARNLVRQLLAFSRKQPLRVQRVRLGGLVAGAEKLLRRVIGEEIRLEVRVEDADAATMADPGQLEQVLMNLAVNARDAMLMPLHGHPGTGGTLTVEVATVALGAAEAAAWEGARPGAWVRVRVRDTGHGMDPATLAHAFEPFFTTKQVGAGTGLGLATVFGIVRQAGGAVRVESAPGAGTTFTILLPSADGGEEPAAPRPGPGTQAAPAPAATVLLVEDEPAVRSATRRMLERRGYTVREAANGRLAMAEWRRAGGEVDLLVTDVRMPEMGGLELVTRLRAERPALPVVFMTGYVDGGVPESLGLAGEVVEKPFVADVLLAAVGRVLEGAPPR